MTNGGDQLAREAILSNLQNITSKHGHSGEQHGDGFEKWTVPEASDGAQALVQAAPLRYAASRQAIVQYEGKS